MIPSDLTMVIPIRDEDAAIRGVVDEVLAAAPTAQVIVVDDGSGDRTWAVVRDLCAHDRRVRGIRLRRRAGKSAALRAGIEACTSDLIGIIDGDGQDVASELPKLLAAVEEGTDLVGGRRRTRADSARKRLASFVFNTAVSLVTGVRVRDHNTGFKVGRAEVFRDMPLHGDLHRFVFVLAKHRGFTIGEVDVAHRPRLLGHSKYGALRAVTSLADLVLVRAHIAVDGRAPQWLALAGFLGLVGGLFALAYLAATWIGQRAGAEGYVPLMERPLILYAILAVIAGGNCLSLAYLGGLLSARAGHPPPIAETVGSTALAPRDTGA
jgi:dolichol-phosphate mannosyltransferase